jgi:hypothetical protein
MYCYIDWQYFLASYPPLPPVLRSLCILAISASLLPIGRENMLGLLLYQASRFRSYIR